ncbi:hypothetical protein GEV33_011122 [Tenebrio molitor]|uniref:Uncharacterized protein n=1 Tax=Tenebrio molitor TaxID=7067 RepID=A0A8J6HBK8_TENMO|nr:hypothetical protein GEV33_011122 [Tenebrio molitor]
MHLVNKTALKRVWNAYKMLAQWDHPEGETSPPPVNNQHVLPVILAESAAMLRSCETFISRPSFAATSLVLKTGRRRQRRGAFPSSLLHAKGGGARDEKAVSVTSSCGGQDRIGGGEAEGGDADGRESFLPFGFRGKLTEFSEKLERIAVKFKLQVEQTINNNE